MPIRKTSLLFLLLLLVAITANATKAEAQAVPQNVDPIHNFTPTKDPNEVYVPASITQVLPTDARIDIPDSDVEFFTVTPVIVQKLTDRSYLVLYNVFGSLVYKGDNGLLVVDCGGHFGDDERARLLDGLAQIGGWDSPTNVGSGLPLHTLVLTHPHVDHVGNSVFLKQMFPNVRIVASRWFDDEVRINNLPIERPTRVIQRRFGSFYFEGQKFTHNTPIRSAHTGADSYIITPDKVLMTVDFFHANRVPVIELSVVRDVLGYVQFLRYLAGEAQAGNWTIASVGHFNVGYPRDVYSTLDYMEDLFDSWGPAFLQNPFQNYIGPGEINIAVPLRNLYDAIATSMFYIVAPVWGNVRHFEVGLDHTEIVNEVKWLSFLSSLDPNSVFSKPDFTPIPPKTKIYSPGFVY